MVEIQINLLSERIDIQKDDVVLLVKIKNEAFRLPFFLHYYRLIGFTKFIFIDNGSTDGGPELLLQERDVFVFQSFDTFRNQQHWVNYILPKYVFGNWCLIVDMDEFFAYPFYERYAVKKLIAYLEKNNYDLASAILLDIYSNKPIREVIFDTKVNPILYENYFDGKFKQEREVCWGGMRERVFGISPHISKQPFFKVIETTKVASGTHSCENKNKIFFPVILFHSKYDSTFEEKIRIAITFRQYYSNSVEYEAYKKVFEENINLNLYCKDSVIFKNVESLEESGLIKIPGNYVSFFQETFSSTQKSLSVVVYVKNKTTLDGIFVSSLLHQKYKNFELVIVTSSISFDTTCLIGLNYTVIYEPVCTKSCAKNKGLYASSGESILFLEDLSALSSDYFNVLIIQSGHLRSYISETYYGVTPDNLADGYTIDNNFFANRRTFLMYGAFDSSLNDGEDAEFIERVKRMGGKIQQI